MASTMQLEFSQAMSDFKTMFPDMDREVIEAVLRANQGAVDQTIDQLLAMSTDNQNEKLRNELDARSSPERSLINLNDGEIDVRHNPTSVAIALTAPEELIDTTDGVVKNVESNNSHAITDLATRPSPHHNTGASPKQRAAMQLPTMNNSIPNNHNTSPSIKHNFTNTSTRWQPPILGTLPAGFLRLVPIGGFHDFELPDEQFALMLQNEEFMNQLRWNQEFMNALEKEQAGKAKSEDDAAFKERLKNMGKLSRKKFLQMARVFTWQRNKKVTTAKQIDSLPLKEEPSDDEEAQHQRQLQHHEQLQVRK